MIVKRNEEEQPFAASEIESWKKSNDIHEKLLSDAIGNHIIITVSRKGFDR